MELILYTHDRNLDMVTVNSISELVSKIEKYHNIPVENQKLTMEDKILNLSSSLNDNGLKNGDIIKIETKITSSYLKDDYDDFDIIPTLLCIKCESRNIAFQAIIDTGAQINAISRELCRILNLKIDIRYKSEVMGVGKSTIYGQVQIDKLMIDNITLNKINFKVIDFPVSKYVCIFGLNFMNNHDAILHVRNKNFMINGKNVHLLNEIEIMSYKEPHNIIEIRDCC